MNGPCPGVETAPTRAAIRREQVLAAARKLFIDNGFHATGMAQIAKTSGVAVGQIYRDFSSKEDIVAAMVEADCGRLMMYDQLESALAARDVGAVRNWLREFIEPSDNPDDAPLFAEILAEAARNQRIREIFRQTHDELREHMDAALELIGPGAAMAERRAVLADVIGTLSIGIMNLTLKGPGIDPARAVRGAQAVLEREIDSLVEASRQAA